MSTDALPDCMCKVRPRWAGHAAAEGCTHHLDEPHRVNQLVQPDVIEVDQIVSFTLNSIALRFETKPGAETLTMIVFYCSKM